MSCCLLGKKEGSLGIHNLFTLNKALVGRWNWRFAMERDLLWKQIIIEKFGEEEGNGGASNKDSWVAYTWGQVREWGDLSSHFSRQLNDWGLM